MSLFAFEDELRQKKALAVKCSDRSKRFYCPDPQCDAHLFLCNQDGVSKAYFRATLKSHPHNLDCYYKNSNVGSIENFDEKAFKFDSFMENLFKSAVPQNCSALPSNNSKLPSGNEIKQVRTIRQIYDLCKSMDINDEFAGIKIWKMLLDNRSVKIYTKGVFGKKLIEAKFRNYSKDSKTIFVKLEDRFIFTLNLNDESLFNKILSGILENRGGNIVVAGDWKGDGDKFHANITSQKQIWISKEK